MNLAILRGRSAWLLLVAVVLMIGVGCEPPPKAPSGAAGPGSAPTMNNAPAPPIVGSAGTSSATGAAPVVPAAEATNTIPPELIANVNELVRLTKEYNAIAAKIQTRDDYVQNLDKLSELDTQLEPYVIGLEVDQAKLAPAARAEFDRKYFEGLAKPIVEEKRAHIRRFATLL